MVVNMNMRGTREGNINQYLADTIASVFSEVTTVDVAGSTNRELFASDNPEMEELLAQRSDRLTDRQLAALMERVQEHLVPYQAGNYVMTDDQAPVELLGIQVIDGLIQEEAAYYRDVLDEEGVSGLLNRLT